ncbi:ROK family transcriptional regulator [Companilactobacillus sp. DQM5]|uniref:ROK family transcriptional regulator n=1 Tax=Companilactobacillus sp. DQM5 TaxID=3463359 RepID=UPI004059C0C2
MPSSINQDSMRDLNLKYVLQYLFNNPSTSRIDIANHLKLNKSTISSLFNELNKKGYITEIGQGTSSESGGRKPTLIKFNQNYGYTVNFELGHHHLRAMTNWITGEKITFTSVSVIDLNIYSIIELMKQHIKKTQIPSLNGLLGISVAINGIVFNNTVVDSPFIDMKNVDLVKELSIFNVPVLLENEANLAAIATRDFTTSSNIKNLIALNVHNGIGAGIIINNKLYKGSHGEAGELGRSILFPSKNNSNKIIPIEKVFSEDAIINELKKIKKIKHMDRLDLLALYKKQDSDAISILNSFSKAIAFIIFNIKQMLSPEIISLQSRIVGEAPELIEKINKNYFELSQKNEDFRLILSPMTEDAPLYGGASLLTHLLLSLDEYTLYLKM